MSVEFNENQFAFKAWIEKTSVDGTMKLHVHGHLEIEDETLLYQLEKRIDQGDNSEELFLVIKPDPTPGHNRIALKYHENTSNENVYKKVTILTKSGQVFEIHEIGVRN